MNARDRLHRGSRDDSVTLIGDPSRAADACNGSSGRAMRLKSAIWVAAYIRRCQVEGVFAAVRRRGAEEAGAIFIKINRLDGTADLYGPAPQATFDEAQPSDRAFSASLKAQPAPEADVDAYLARETRFDPDVWIVETEDREGRHFLDHVVR
jgi:hypothetical protein